MAATKLSLKLLVDKKAKKVLFAEAGKDFVDFLFHLLSLSVGAVIRLLTNESMVGCIGNLYESVGNLNQTYMQPNQNKESLLKPLVPCHVANVPLLLPNADAKEHTKQGKLYICRNNHGCVTDCYGTRCSCGKAMTYEVEFISNNNSTTNSTGEGGYVKGLVTYMVTDDLLVSPMSMISGVAVMNKFNVKDFGTLEERVVECGIDEGVELLKASLQTNSALTTVFLIMQEAIKVKPTKKQEADDVATSNSQDANNVAALD